MGESFNSEHKVLIRNNWNMPLLKFLAKKINSKLVYMGLPSPNAEDLHDWIDFVKIVIAFQCRQYGHKSEPDQSRDQIEKLEELLRTLEREKKIENFIVYDGYLEEVIIKGFDNSPNRISFNQDSIITLYNLDFCNDIASPLEYTDENGDEKKVYKFDAIQKLLEIQKQLSEISDKFLFLLTVHCSYNGKELQNFINEPPNLEIANYIKKYFGLKGVEKNSRIVRLFMAHQIRNYFLSNNFSCILLPVIKYSGLNNTPLLHFVVLGTKQTPGASGVFSFQSFNDIIDQTFIIINENDFISGDQLFEESKVEILNSIECFTRSKTYQNLWR